MADVVLASRRHKVIPLGFEGSEAVPAQSIRHCYRWFPSVNLGRHRPSLAWPSMVPTVRLTLPMVVEKRTGLPESSASLLITISC